jgi:endonuclease/exonuclease/phosphatase (EEP) superfamily protein YafD
MMPHTSSSTTVAALARTAGGGVGAQQQSSKTPQIWQANNEPHKEHNEQHFQQSSGSHAKNGVLYVASCHLIGPHQQNADKRAAQLEALVRHINDREPGAAVILAGDMNIWKAAETKNALDNLGLQDAFILATIAGTRSGAKFTWDTRVNQYRKIIRPFASRFDKVFVRGLEVKGYSLVGDEAVGGKPGFYLSDHFGICTELRLLVSDCKYTLPV